MIYRIYEIKNNAKYASAEIIVNKTNKAYNCIYSRTYPEFYKCNLTRLFLIDDYKRDIDLKERYSIMEKDKNIIEQLSAEIEDDYSDDSLFNISSWGADLSFREICSMYEDGELVKPELQRKYVWDRIEASRFIESILMGLPVPSIFFAQSGSQKLIVDGYQRIMTVNDYIRGIFTNDGKVFKLSNSSRINSRWRNKAFSELSIDEQRKIRSTTIHVIIFEQKQPKDDDTSMYQIFERINTSGRTLTAQEIRNCVYQGTFNTLLFELNSNTTWRTLFGSKKEDSRMRDIECIVRFFVMSSPNVRNTTLNQISLKKELNDFMGKFRNASEDQISKFREDFISTMEKAYNLFGENAFRNFLNNKFTKKFHPAIFDAISVAIYDLQNNNSLTEHISIEEHQNMLTNPEFNSAATIRTTDVENIHKRINIAKECLGVVPNEN